MIIKELANLTASAVRGDKPAAPADVWNPSEHRLYCTAGDNKYGHEECPWCGKPPTVIPDGAGHRHVFFFNDTLSVREYQISGLCQSCQSGFFSDEGC